MRPLSRTVNIVIARSQRFRVSIDTFHSAPRDPHDWRNFVFRAISILRETTFEGKPRLSDEQRTERMSQQIKLRR